MDRTACIDLPGFPLQLLLLRHPDWREHPAAVVEADKPQGIVLWVNELARALRVLPGMRYAAGLSLAPGLRAGVVSGEEIREGVKALAERFRKFTPNVEPSADEPGVFWLDARGLERLFPSLDDWASRLHAEAARAGFEANVVVGFKRFGTYALAKAHRGVHVLKNAAEECQGARAVPLDRLALPPAARDALARLGIATVGGFTDLPEGGIAARFGPEVRRLHRLASGDLEVPLQPERPDVPAMRRLILDHPDEDAGRLIAAVEGMLGPLLDEVAEKGRALAELTLGLRFERLGDHVEKLRPASPSLDAGILMELVRLRLQALRKLPDRVAEVVLAAGETEAAQRKQRLFPEAGGRDLAAANRALARLRARLGDDAVVRARPRDAHLPEASFAWERLETLGDAAPRPVDEPRLIRRIHAHPRPLPPRERHEPDGWMLRGLEQGPVVRVLGPYVVSGGWWERPAHRDYHFAETKDGEILWVFYDRTARRWFLQGRVE